MWPNQGNLKGESVVAAIMLSRMDVSYYTFGFFRSYDRQAILLSVCCLSCVTYITHAFRLSCSKHAAMVSYANCVKMIAQNLKVQ